MSKSHALGGICNKVTGNERILHSLMTHCNTVANCDSGEYNRCTPCHSNAHLYGFNDLVDVHVTGNDLIVGRNDTYQRSFHFLIDHSESVEK